MISAADLDFDKQHIWHPYSRMNGAAPCFAIESASGCELTLADGRKVIDGMASWWSAIHGYNHPRLNHAAKAQIDKMAHVMFGGLTHEPAIRLCQQLVDMTHPDLQHVFLADSGSVAVEVAMKMAVQFWVSQGERSKTQFVTFKNGYHGDTFATMSVCDPENGMHSLFGNAVTPQFFVDAPKSIEQKDWPEQYIQPTIEAVADCLQKNAKHIAAIIVEPVVQGAGGMRFYSPKVLEALRDLANQHQVLLIFDEIATGFGRTGKLFAYEWAGVCPDILCVGKALTGGYMTLAATLTSSLIAHTISDNPPHAFMHGPTFMGNPLACAVASESLRLLQNTDWQQRVAQIQAWLTTALKPLENDSKVKQVRVLGAIGVVEMQQPVDVAKLCEQFVAQGVWLRPYMNLIYMMPPYIITQSQINQIANAIKLVISQQ